VQNAESSARIEAALNDLQRLDADAHRALLDG